MKRLRQDNAEDLFNTVRTAYKQTLQTDLIIGFTLRGPHSRYISFQENFILETIPLVTALEVTRGHYKNNDYLSDVVLHPFTQEELIDFYKNYIGEESFKKISDKGASIEEHNIDDGTSKKDEVTNSRYQVIALKNRGYPRKEIGKLLKISVNQVKYILNLASKNKIEKRVEQKKFGQIWYDELSLYLSASMRRHTSLYEMRRHLCHKLEAHPKDISLATICGMIRRIGYSYKRTRAGIEHRNNKRTIDIRYQKSIEYLALLKQQKNLIFIDETGFHRGIIPIYGYSKIGQPLVFMRPKLSENYSVIAAVTQKQVLGYQIFRGGVKAEHFGSFLISLIEDNPQIKNNLDNWIFYMDNATIHKARVLKPFLDKIRVFYAAPYSPFLNPIEEFFGLWKHYFRQELLTNEKNYPTMILKSLRHITQDNIIAFYFHSLDFIYPSIMKESIQ